MSKYGIKDAVWQSFTHFLVPHFRQLLLCFNVFFLNLTHSFSLCILILYLIIACVLLPSGVFNKCMCMLGLSPVTPEAHAQPFNNTRRSLSTCLARPQSALAMTPYSSSLSAIATTR